MKTMKSSQEMQVRRLVALMSISDYIIQHCSAEGGPAMVVIQTQASVLKKQFIQKSVFFMKVLYEIIKKVLSSFTFSLMSLQTLISFFCEAQNNNV